jgi:hypothetical protein
LIEQGDGANNGDVPADNFVVSNNIVIDNGQHGIHEGGATGPNNEYLNNILWNNGDGNIDLDTGRSQPRSTDECQVLIVSWQGKCPLNWDDGSC